MLNGRELRRKFIEFNAQYFANRLPPCSIRVVEKIPELLFAAGLYTPGLIQIRSDLTDEEAIGNLIHEMTHAATPKPNLRNNHAHGKRWRREMIRLKEAGAPLLAKDMVIGLDWPYYALNVTPEQFRDYVILMWPPTFHEAVKCFLWEGLLLVGPAPSVRVFLRMYPWAETVYREAFAATPEMIGQFNREREEREAEEELGGSA